MNDIDLDGMTDEQLMQIAGISQNAQNEQTEQQQTASQTQSFDQNAGYTPEQMDSMTDEQLLRIAGIAHPQNGYSGTVQTSQGVPAEQENPDAPKPLSDAELAEAQNGVVNEGDTPLSKGVESFMDSWFGQGRKDAMDNYRRQTRDGGVGGSVLGYLSDLGNSFWSGLVGGGAKIAEAAGRLTGSDGLVQGAERFEAGVNEYMPTDMTDTAQRLDENGVPVERTWGRRIADEGKNVVRMAGEFAPASIPGVGGAFTYAMIGSGGVNRYNELVKEAMDNGLSKAQARIIGGAGGAIDAFSNAFLMGKFRGKGVPPIEERYFKSFVGKMLAGAAKTAGVMGVSGGAQDALQQMAENGDFDIERTGNAVLDGAIQGAMFHVMNEGLHAPVKWSAAKAKRAADARMAEMADVDSMRADAANEAEAERDARISADLSAQSAMKVLEEPLGVAKFIQQNQDASLDIINARRLGRDVDMDALLADGPEGIPDVLKPAFRTQQDANAFGDRLLEYYYNGRKAEERAQRESGIRQAFDDYDRRNSEEYIADQAMRERWKENLETARAEEDAARARTRRGEDIEAAFADHDRAVAERRQELAKKRADRIAGKIEDDVRAADESRVAQDAMELADRDAELKAMREANKGREKSVADEAREDARIQREEKANADAQDRATAEDAARYDAEVEDAATRFRNGEGIPSYEQWLGNRADTKAMRWKYDAMVNEAARKKIGVPKAEAEGVPPKTEQIAERAPVTEASPVAEASPHTAEKGTVDASVSEAVNQPTETREAPTEAQGADSSYQAWLSKQTGRDGKPKNDSKAMRMQYETIVKGMEKAENILSSLKRISSYENILPRVSSEKLIETLNDSRAKDPKYADMISKVRAELERRGKLPSEPPKTAQEPQKTRRTAPNEGYSYEDYAGETGDDIGHAILRDGPKLNIPEGLMEYRRAVANWNKLKDKSSRPKPKMSDFGVTDPSADFINNLLDGASRADRIRLFGFKPAKGGNDGFAERLHDPALRAAFDRYAEQYGASAALEKFASDMLGAHERYGKWSSEKRTAEADRKAENEILNERMEDLLKAEKDENAEWDSALGEIESGDEGFGANGEYIIPFSRARLSQAKRGDIIRFGKDKTEFTLLGFDKDSGVMEVVGEDGGNPRFFEVYENGVKEVRNGRNEKESVQNHDRDENGERRGQGEGGEGGEGEFQLESATPEQLEAERVRRQQREEIARRQAQPIKGGGEYGQTLMDLGGAEGEDLFNRTTQAQGDAPAKPETDIKALGAAAKKAMQDLRSMGAVDDRTLASYSRQWRKQKGDRFQRMADAADTVLKYREAVKNQQPRDGGAFRGSAEDAGETRYSRTVSDAERSDQSVVSRIADRLSRLVPGVKVKVAELSPDERAAGAVASYDRRTGTATFSPDANLADVVHEIGGHAIRQWAERNCPELLRKALEYARNAPREIKDYVYRSYADRRADGSYVYDGNALLDEIFAHRFAKEHGEEFRRMLEEKPKARKWWANISNAVRSVFQNAAKRNGVDTESIKGLDAESYMKGVAEQLVAGKELNEWTAYGRDAKYLGAKAAPVGSGGDDRRYSRSSDLDRDFPGWNDNPGSTQISTTVTTYGKLGTWFRSKHGEQRAKEMKILDASSGLGYGSAEMRRQGLHVEDVEPYQTADRKGGKGRPYVDKKSGNTYASDPATYDSYDKVPDGEYDLVVSNAVLNVIPDDWRANVLRDMSRKVKPGGQIYINVLPKDYVYGLRNPMTRDEALVKGGRAALAEGRPIMLDPQEALARNAKGGSYQRGYSKSQMADYVHEILGNDWKVEPSKIANGVMVTRPEKASVDSDVRHSLREYVNGPYDERTEDGRRFNEKYADASLSRTGRGGLGRVGDAIERVNAGEGGHSAEEGEVVLRDARENGYHLGGVEEGETRYARKPFRDGETEKHGMETIHVYRDGDSVYKYRRPETVRGSELEKVRRHNELFGDRTKYEVVGVAEDENGNPSIVLKQPYVDLMPRSGNFARKQLEADLRRRFGDVEVSRDGMEMRAGGWVIDDLKDVNIGIDSKTGRYAVVDALVRRNEDFPGGKPPKMDAEYDLGANGEGTVLREGSAEYDEMSRRGDAAWDEFRRSRGANKGTVDADGEQRYSRRADDFAFSRENTKLTDRETRNGYELASSLAGRKFKEAEVAVRNVERGASYGLRGDEGEARGEGAPSKVRIDGVVRELERRGAVIADGVDPFAWASSKFDGRFEDGSRSKRGSEAVVYKDGNDVVKMRLANGGARMLKGEMQYIKDFNFMFGKDSHYTLDGFVRSKDGRLFELIRQRNSELVKGSDFYAFEKIVNGLSERFGNVEESNGVIIVGNKEISDLSGDNVGIDARTGRPFVRDCDIHTLDENGNVRYSRRADEREDVRVTRSGNTITFGRREKENDNGMHDSGLRDGGRDVGGGSPDRLSFVERTSYRPNRIHDLFRSLNSDADSSALAERVFAAADSLGARFGFGDIRKVSKNEDAVGAERMGRALYDSEYFARGDVNDQAKADKILHEAIHSVTSYALSITDGGHALSDVGRVNARLREATSDLRDVYLQSLDRLGDAYGAKNEYEFVAELSNPSFRSKLKNIGVWDRTVNAVKRIIDSVLGTNLSRTNANDAAMRALDRILENGDLEAFGTARKFAADRDPVAEREFGDPVDADGETMYSRRSYDDRELRDLISFKPGDVKISRKEIDNGYKQAGIRSGVLARRIEALLGNDEGGRARVGSGDAGGARKARELAGVQGEGRTNEGALERVLRGVSAPLGKWRTDPEMGLRNSTSPFPDGEMSKIGGESEVFYDKRHGDVLKLRNLDSFEGIRLPHIPQYANDFNFFFGKFSPITIDSFGVTRYGDGVKGKPNEIIRQKYAEFKKDGWEEALVKIHEDLSRRFPGMKWLGNEIAQIGNKRISDLHSDNLGIDVRTGRPFVRDCNIDSAGDYSYETERSPMMYSRRVTPEQDREYMDAVRRGDMETARTLLKEAWERSGYSPDTSYKDAHAAPSAPVEAKDFKNVDALEEARDEGWDLNLWAIAKGITGQPDDFFDERGPSLYGYDDAAGREAQRAVAQAIADIRGGNDKTRVIVYRAVPKGVKFDGLQSGGQWVSPSKTYVENHGKIRFGYGEYRIVRQVVRAENLWWDGNDAREWGYDDGLQYVYTNAENGMKLATVTYDDAGNVIPLSQRFDSSSQDIRYSRRSPRSANGQKSVDEKESFGTKLRRAVQDNLVGWRNVQDETGGVRDVVDGNTGHTDFRKSTDFYEAKDRQNGYEEKDMRALQRTRDSIDETLVDAGVSNDDFGKFLALRHAEERNRAIARKNGVAFTMGYADGAGISSSRANSMLNAMRTDPAKAAALDSAGNAYDAMMRADLDRRLASGRISQDDYDNLSQYKHYAPLRRDQSSDALGMFNSSTGGMKKNEFVGAKGLGADRLFDQNGNLTVNPYEFGLIQAQEGIRGSLENESRLVLRNLVNLANSRGNTLGEIVDGQAMPRGAGYTFEFGNGDRVVADSGYNIAGNRRDIVLFKDGGKLKAIRIDAGENGNGLRLADAANGRDMAKWHKALEWIPKMTRAMAAMRTQYVPTFIARNFKADTLEAMTAALGRFGVKDAASIAKDMVKAEVSNAKDLKDYIKDGTLNGYVREAVEGGLLTKGGTASQGFDDMVSKIKNHRAKLEREKKAWYRRGTIDNAKQLLSTLGESISMMNEFAENSTRIGMFTALRKLRTAQYPNGVPVNEAVKFCRDATTNFNRHGWLTPYINGAFMFSNAATQGMTRNIQAVRDVHGRQLVGTLIALGTAEALVNHYFGNDDERENEGKGNARNLSEYEKKHQIGIPIGGGRQAIWQTRGLYATIPYLARTAVDAMLGETKVSDALMNVLSEAGSVATEPLSGNGLSSKATAMQSLSPTLVDPLVQWVSGKDYKGDDRIAKSYNANKPLSWNGKGKTSEGYKWFAKLVNSATGGNEGRKGLVDMAPEDVQLIVETIVGGIGRDVSQIGSGIQTARQLADGESPERVLGETAFMRDWVREYPNVGSRYYAAVNRLNAMKTELASKKTYEEKSAYVRENPIAATKRTKVLEKMEKTIRDYQALGRGMSKDKSGKYVENPHVSAESKKRYNDLAAKMMARFVKEVEKND